MKGLNLPGQEIGKGRRRAADTRTCTTSMPACILRSSIATCISVADAGRGKIDLARIASGVSDEFRDRLGRKRWIDQEHHRRLDHAGDWREIAGKIEIQFGIKRGVDGVGGHA